MTDSAPRVALIVGLANPGAEYRDTRHNAGAWFLEALCEKYQIALKTDSKRKARIAEFRWGPGDCKLLIPNTYMNHSGQSVSLMTQYYRIPSDAILIAHDELDLPPGSVRFKSGGGHGGHNGLRDIMNHLSTRDFHRLRLGIGHPGHKDQVTDYVLQKPSSMDKQKIQTGIAAALDRLPDIMTGQWDKVMNELHPVNNH